MADFFDEMRKNRIMTVFLFVFFFAVVVLFGLIAGFFFGSYLFGIILSVSIGVIYTLIAMNQGDKVILKISKAHEVKKADNPYLVNTVEGLAIAAGIPAPKVYIMNEKAMNAFAVGMKPEKSAIVVTQGLLDNMNRQELEGVIGHEMSHIKNRDTRVMILAAVLAGIIVLIADIIIQYFWFGGLRGGDEDNNSLQILMLIIGLVLIILAPIIALAFRMAISRKREFLADANGAALTRYPEGLASALEKIKNDKHELKNTNTSFSQLYISSPRKKVSFLDRMFASHPPIDERIRRLRAM